MNDADHESEDREIDEGSYGLVAAAGWCAPSAAIYDSTALGTNVYSATLIDLPEVTVPRGGIKYEWHEPTEEDRIRWKAEEAFRAFVKRHIKTHVGDIEVAKHVAIDQALTEATDNGYGVWVHRKSHTRFVGISLAPGPVTIHYIESDGGDYYTNWGHDADEFIDLIEDN